MKAETYRDLIEWTQQLHGQLASRLEAGAADSQTGERMSALLRYLAEHERRMQQMVLRFEQQADTKVLDSWVYDHFTDNPRMRMLTLARASPGWITTPCARWCLTCTTTHWTCIVSAGPGRDGGWA
ncbi:hypothetical protein ULG90_15285 [Halopseudomonas pachastrellae]|nr:hypothetical protein ULG90_15285 [Halopseudomonas pachastrellae]